MHTLLTLMFNESIEKTRVDPEQNTPTDQTDVDLDASKHNSRRQKQTIFCCELIVTHWGTIPYGGYCFHFDVF